MKFQNKVLLGALRGHQNAVPFTVLDPVMGLVPFLAGQLRGGLAESFNGFQFLPYTVLIWQMFSFIFEFDLAKCCYIF